MAKPPDTEVVINDFPGMVEDADPNDIPPGAAVLQLNCMSLIPGKLTIRSGYLPLAFEATTTETV